MFLHKSFSAKLHFNEKCRETASEEWNKRLEEKLFSFSLLVPSLHHSIYFSTHYGREKLLLLHKRERERGKNYRSECILGACPPKERSLLGPIWPSSKLLWTLGKRVQCIVEDWISGAALPSSTSPQRIKGHFSLSLRSYIFPPLERISHPSSKSDLTDWPNLSRGTPCARVSLLYFFLSRCVNFPRDFLRKGCHEQAIATECRRKRGRK